SLLLPHHLHPPLYPLFPYTTLFRSHSRADLLIDAVLVLEHHVDAADVEERLLGDVVEVAVADALEALDGVLQRDVGAVHTGELLREVGVLRQELLDATRPRDGDLVLLG